MQHLHVTIGNGQMSSESRATGRMSNMQSFTWRPQRPGFCLYRRMDFYILILTAAKAYCYSILLFVCGWREIKHITGSSGLSGEGREALLVAASCCPAIFLFEISIYQAAVLYSNAQMFCFLYDLWALLISVACHKLVFIPAVVFSAALMHFYTSHIYIDSCLRCLHQEVVWSNFSY